VYLDGAFVACVYVVPLQGSLLAACGGISVPEEMCRTGTNIAD